MPEVRVLVISGGTRSRKSCPGQDSKTVKLAAYAARNPPENVTVDWLDLAVKGDGKIIQPCKGCISTANGYHCHWPCTCWGPDSGQTQYDLLHRQNVYERLSACDGFIVYTPMHWYSVSTPIKTMFDRLVCASGTLSREDGRRYAFDDTEEAGGTVWGKDPSKTIPAEEAGEQDDKLRNWLEGKVAAFFLHGDGGADDFKRKSPPEAFDPEEEDQLDDRQDARAALRPLILQCQYSGIFVPDDCVTTIIRNKGVPYSEANKRFKKDLEFKMHARRTFMRLVGHLRRRT